MNYNFYQSPLRQHINKQIYCKPTSIINILDKEYQYIVKRKSVLGINVNRYQVLWVELDRKYLENPSLFRDKVMKLCHHKFASQWDCFVQLWLINQLGITDTNMTKSDDYRAHRDALRCKYESTMMRLWWYHALVENMPEATILIDLSVSQDDLYQGLSRNTRKHISKASNAWLSVDLASLTDRDVYYDMWVDTALVKGFAVQSQDAYIALRDYLLHSGQWNLHVVRAWDTIIAGAICMQVDNVYVYVYGATIRDVGNLWHAQFLQWKIMQYAHNNWYQHYDLLWASPWSLQSHHLDGVTQFKAWFGGSKIEYLGNYDFPLSHWKYQMFRLYRKTKG